MKLTFDQLSQIISACSCQRVSSTIVNASRAIQYLATSSEPTTQCLWLHSEEMVKMFSLKWPQRPSWRRRSHLSRSTSKWLRKRINCRAFFRLSRQFQFQRFISTLRGAFIVSCMVFYWINIFIDFQNFTFQQSKPKIPTHIPTPSCWTSPISSWEIYSAKLSPILNSRAVRFSKHLQSPQVVLNISTDQM